jgi:predicted RNase H-like nuclease (RuvC/YqgF family)
MKNLKTPVGRDKARIIAESLEESIKNTFKEEQLKTEIEDLKDELVTKLEFDLKINALDQKINALDQKIDLKSENLKKEIELVRKENRLFYFTIIFLMIMLNPDAREFLFKLFTFYK